MGFKNRLAEKYIKNRKRLRKKNKRQIYPSLYKQDSPAS